MKEIHKTELINIDEGTDVIEWEAGNEEFGRITFTYNGDGKYSLDSEYLSLESIIKIIKNVK